MPGIRPNTNKLQRFNIVVPWFKAGKMYFPEDARNHPAVAEIMEELRLASLAGFKSKHDDGIDTISQLASLKPWKPSDGGTMHYTGDGNIWDMNHDSDWNSSPINSYIV